MIRINLNTIEKLIEKNYLLFRNQINSGSLLVQCEDFSCLLTQATIQILVGSTYQTYRETAPEENRMR